MALIISVQYALLSEVGVEGRWRVPDVLSRGYLAPEKSHPDDVLRHAEPRPAHQHLKASRNQQCLMVVFY